MVGNTRFVLRKPVDLSELTTMVSHVAPIDTRLPADAPT